MSTILNENSQVITKGNLDVENVSFTMFKTKNDKRFTYINVTNGEKYSEHCFYDYEAINMLQALNNMDFEAISEINDYIGAAVKSFYNFSCINDNIIKEVAKILNVTLSDHEIELYNQDFSNTNSKDDLYCFSEKTFNNNWFYCLGHIKSFNGLTDDEIVTEIVRYYMKVFISCCIECNSDIDELYD